MSTVHSRSGGKKGDIGNSWLHRDLWGLEVWSCDRRLTIRRRLGVRGRARARVSGLAGVSGMGSNSVVTEGPTGNRRPVLPCLAAMVATACTGSASRQTPC